MKYDAVLRNYLFVTHGAVTVLYGDIYKDSKGRFSDGVEVRTSAIKNTVEYPDGTIIAETRNTLYKLENPLDKEHKNI